MTAKETSSVHNSFQGPPALQSSGQGAWTGAEYLGARPLTALGSPSLYFFRCKNENLPTNYSYPRSTQFLLVLGLGSLLSGEPQ